MLSNLGHFVSTTQKENFFLSLCFCADQVITASGLGTKRRCLRCLMGFAQPEDREEESLNNKSQSLMDICQILFCSM